MDELDLRAAERPGMPADEVTLDFTARLRPGVGSAVLEDEAILLDPATGVSHLLDAPGTLVLRCLDGTTSLGVIAADIADVLELDPDTVANDVIVLVRALGGHGLVDGVDRDSHVGHQHSSGPSGVPVGADLSGWAGWAGLRVQGGRTLLVNWGTSCGYCTRISPELAELAPSLDAVGVRLVLVTTGDDTAFREQVGDLDLPVLHVDETPEFFANIGTPVAYLVGADKTVLEPLAVGANAVPVLCRSATGVSD